MILSITQEELKALSPCDLASRLKLFKEQKSLNVAQALERGASIRDILWVAAKVGRRDLCVKFALLCAQRVEALDKSGKAKACNDAVALYIADPTRLKLEALRTARSVAAEAGYGDYAADASAYAADAAYADADAAYADAYAADAAADAAYADADAAYADAYAAYADAYAAYADADAAYADADAAYADADAAYADAYAADARNNEIEAQKRILVEVFTCAEKLS